MLLFSFIIDHSHVLCLWDELLFLTKREQQHWLSEGHSLLLAKSHNCALACCFTAVAPTLVYMWRVSQQRPCVIINLWNAVQSSFTAPTFVCFSFCFHYIFDPWLIFFSFVILVWYLLNWFLVSYSSILEVLVLMILILMVILPFNVLWSLVFWLIPWLFLVAVCLPVPPCVLLSPWSSWHC